MGSLKPQPKMAVLRFLLLATILSAATAAKYLLEASASTGGMRRKLASKKASNKKSKAPMSKAKGSKTTESKTTESKTRGSKTSSSLSETDTAVPMLMSNQGKIMDILIDFKLATASQVLYHRYRRYDLHGPCMQDPSMHETSRYGRDMPDPGIYILLHATRGSL